MVDKIDKQQMAAGHKVCTGCREAKPISDFYDKAARCKPCYCAETSARYRRNRPSTVKPRFRGTPEEVKERARRRAFKYRMGITMDERDAMLAAQGGVCAICKSADPNGPTWCTDHDHACCPGKSNSCGECIRGILCFRCNTFLGHALDDTEILRSGIGYLMKWEARRG